MKVWSITSSAAAQASVARGAMTLAFACCAGTLAGCQLVLADIDPMASDPDLATRADATGDDARVGGHDVRGPDASSISDGRMDTNDDEDAAVPGAREAGMDDAAPQAGRDAAADVDGRRPEAPDAGARDSAAPPDVIVDVACANPMRWYEDRDGDGYGRASAGVEACARPADDWAEEPGDCNDDDDRVHPAQPAYFDAAYQAPDGSLSFDYDCSGAEEGNDVQTAFTSCGLLAPLALCSGAGYLPTDRANAPNPVCGSAREVTCQGAVLGTLACEAVPHDVVEAYRCR